MGKKQKVIAYLEICFECSKYESNNPDLKILCWNQFDILKNFLKNCGVKEGFDINSMDPNSSKK
jgi:hypothetical protein